MAATSLIAYPFITVKRRIECQTKQAYTMIPKRYYNSIHAFQLISKEEGIKGFYKGFSLFALEMLMVLEF